MRLRSGGVWWCGIAALVLALSAQADMRPLAQDSRVIEVGFSPDAGAEPLVVKAIGSARQSIRLAAYSFTSKPVVQALIAAQRRGVEVLCVLDKTNIKQKSGSSAANLLVNAGIGVRVDSRHAIQHNKYLVIDGRTVETGSFNYSKAAAHSNAENVLVIWNDPALAAKYLQDWERHWQHAQPWRSTY